MTISRDEIAEKLKEKGALLPCSRCGKQTFIILDEQSNMVLDKKIDENIKIEDSIIPVTTLLCTNCGAITIHALGALGLSNNKNSKK